MEPSTLLELAKQGEPTAIAALMNAVLKPKGITAYASVDKDCLYIFLESAKPLNQDTLIAFLRKGLLELGNHSIRRVKAHGTRTGQETVAWSREFWVHPVEVEQPERIEADPSPLAFSEHEPIPLAAESHVALKAEALKEALVNEPEAETPEVEESPISSNVEPEFVELVPVEVNGKPSSLDVEASNTAELNFQEDTSSERPPEASGELNTATPIDLSLPEEFGELEESNSTTIDLSLPEGFGEPEESNSPEIDLSLPEGFSEPEESSTSPIDLSLPEGFSDSEESNSSTIDLSLPEGFSDPDPEDTNSLASEEEPDDEEHAEHSQSFKAWLKAHWKPYSLSVGLVVIGGFIAGGTVAFLSTSKTQTRQQSQVEQALQPKDQTLGAKQKEAEDYLKAMNSAQEKFYKKNNRFAGSLEELERSANLISQSYSYAYRLRVSSPTKGQVSEQSMMTAIPRENGLKSYVGAVFVVPSGTANVICQSLKPSVEAPTRPEFKKKAECGARSQKLP